MPDTHSDCAIDCDIIVVGAGSAGCAMAARLADAGLRVELLEAGKNDADIRIRIPALTTAVAHNPNYDWGYPAEPDASVEGRADKWPAGKRLGGGNRIRGDSGPIFVSDNRVRYPIIDAFIDAAVDYGIARNSDHNGIDAGEGVDYSQASRRNGLRCSSAQGYLHSGPHRPGLKVRTQITVRIRVRGISQLWVADASVMPTLPVGNTNATAIMIGDKGADHVLRAMHTVQGD